MLRHVIVVDRFELTARGEGSGVAPLTWGQRSMLLTIAREQSWMPMGGCTPVPPGTTLADIVAELRYSLGRHQSFRTRVHDDAGGPRQVVEAVGVLPLEVYETSDPLATAAEVELAYRAAAPDLAVDWPVRAAVVSRAGHPEHLIVLMPHMVTDAFGAMVMLREASSLRAEPVAGTQPLELAAWQHSPAGDRQTAAALRHWQRHLADCAPLRPGAALTLPPPQRNRKAVFTSPVLARAVPLIAARTGVDPSTVLSTAFMAAFARVTGQDRVATRLLVSNRFRAGLSDVVSPLAQFGLCVADVSGTFDEAVVNVARASLSAHKHAYYDPRRLASATGDDTTRTVCFNDRRTRRDATPPAAAGPGELVWTTPLSGPVEPMFVHVDDVPGALVLTVDVDTAYVSEAEAEACLRGMEAAVS